MAGAPRAWPRPGSSLTASRPARPPDRCWLEAKLRALGEEANATTSLADRAGLFDRILHDCLLIARVRAGQYDHADGAQLRQLGAALLVGVVAADDSVARSVVHPIGTLNAKWIDARMSGDDEEPR